MTINELYKKITFVIPSYKNVETLKRAIDSIIKQLKFNENNCQIIISEDMSENHDMIQEVVKLYEEYNIKYVVNNPPKGMTGNWNYCISMVDTEYVIMLHDDDYLYPNYINVLLNLFNSGVNFDVVMFDNVVISDNCKDMSNSGVTGIKKIYENLKKNKIKRVTSADYYFGSLQGKYVPTCGIIYKKSFIDNTPGYEKNDGYSVDEIFIEKWNKKGKLYFYNVIVAVHTYTTNTNLSSQREVKKSFAIEGYNYRKQMALWYAKLLNYVFKDGIFFHLVYPWHGELFPNFKVTKMINAKRIMFSIICRCYIYSTAFRYKKLR